MRINNDTLLAIDAQNNSVPLSMATSFNLDPIWLGHICNFSISLVFTGTPSGNFKLQCSNDLGRPDAAKEEDRDYEIVNWTDITDSAVTVSAAGDITYNYENAGFRWVRVVWTQTASTGSLTVARFNVKGV